MTTLNTAESAGAAHQLSLAGRGRHRASPDGRRAWPRHAGHGSHEGAQFYRPNGRVAALVALFEILSSKRHVMEGAGA